MAGWFSRLFGVERKASQFGPMHVRLVGGQAAYPERDAAALAREGYQRNVIAYRAIRHVAESAASVPLVLFDGEKEVEEHELLELLDRPNPAQDGIEFTEAWLSFLQISGNFYLERVDGIVARPKELYVLRPDRVRVVPGPTGLPIAYEYRVAGQVRRVPVDFERGDIPILHGRVFHPLDDWYGMSGLEAAAWAIDTHSGSGAYNKALLDNSATPSGALMVKPDKEGDASLVPEQREALQKGLDSRFTGKHNAGRPMVLEGGLEWVGFSHTMEQMQFVETKRDSAREICLGLGVPPMILGIPGDNTYSNYQEANKALWRNTVIPLAQRRARALTNWLCPLYGNRLRFDANIDNLDALAEDREQQWDRIEKSTILTVNEKREALGYEPVEGGDVVLIEASKIPLADAGEDVSGGEEMAPEEGEDAKPKKPKPEDEPEEE